MSEYAETVIAAVQAALKEITTGNGYAITVRSVQQYDRRTLSTADKPCIHLIEGERRRTLEGGAWDVELDLQADLFLYHDPEDTRGTFEVLREGRDAVRAALVGEVDWLGSNAELRVLRDSHFADIDEDSVEDGVSFSLTVYYRTEDFEMQVPVAL